MITFEYDRQTGTTSCKVACDNCGTAAPRYAAPAEALGAAMLDGWLYRTRLEDLRKIRNSWVYPLAEPIEWPCVCCNCMPTWTN